jgi:hypothetical protein
MIGSYAGVDAGVSGSVSNSNMIGSYAGYASGYTLGLSSATMIGSYAGYKAGYYGNLQDVIFLGYAAGNQAAYNIGSSVKNCIFIGLSSGVNQQSSRNTFIGDYTNTTSPLVSSLSGCIAIGYGATPSARNTIAIGSASTPLSVVPGVSLTSSLSGLKIMVNGIYYTIPLLA